MGRYASGDVHVEVVTTAFVASGVPEGIHDLGRLLETLNNPAVAGQLELRAPAVRPLYRAAAPLELEAPLLVRRRDIIFCTFDGPHITRGLVRPTLEHVPALLLVPPFQICGTIAVAPGAGVTPALRLATQGFFAVRDARVFDTEGAALGEGEQIVVNGAAVQMAAASARRVLPAMSAPAARRAAPAAEAEPAAVPLYTERAA